MAQYRVPQNIFMPDRIIGPFTLRQFIYVFTAGAIDLGLYYAFNGGVLFYLIGLPVAAIALILSFVKINDQPIQKVLKSGLGYAGKPKRRIWQKLGPEIQVIQAPKVEKKAVQIRPEEAALKSKLKSLSLMLDTQGWTSIKEKRAEVSGFATVDVPGGVPREAKPVMPSVEQEAVLAPKPVTTTQASPAAEAVEEEIV